MIEFVYPHTQLVAGVDEVGRGPELQLLRKD